MVQGNPRLRLITPNPITSSLMIGRPIVYHSNTDPGKPLAYLADGGYGSCLLSDVTAGAKK